VIMIKSSLIPGADPPPAAFINRKGFYSINSVVVCDFKNKILHHITRHAGSAHDSRIFNESRLNAFLLGQHNPARPKILLGQLYLFPILFVLAFKVCIFSGDSDFQCSPILITPICQDAVQNNREELFNSSLSRARLQIKHLFGVIKRRFPVLRGVMRSTNLDHIGAIIGRREFFIYSQSKSSQ